MKLLLAILLAIVCGCSAAQAHEIRPALLEIVRDEASVCHVTWKQPTVGQDAVPLVPRLSGGWTDGASERERLADTFRRASWSHPGCTVSEIEGQSFAVDGLEASITDVLVRVDYGDGRAMQAILRPGDPPLALSQEQRAKFGAPAYLVLGVEHILEGIDHLSFVLVLVLLVGFTARLAMAITGFTLAHSLTLVATALGAISPWAPFIEALVALSIAFVAAEAIRARHGASSLTIRWPILAAGGFGLIHGFAFAGALADIGLPPDQNLLALGLFNIGVELGQLLFVAVVFVLCRLAVWACTIITVNGWRLDNAPAFALRLIPYFIGALSTHWFIDRTIFLFS